MAVKRASGVDEVANKIEALPTAQNDDRIRWATFYKIYSDDFLSRYAPGGVFGVLQGLRDVRQFPGMQPVGRYPISSSLRTGEPFCWESSITRAIDKLLKFVRARWLVSSRWTTPSRWYVRTNSSQGRQFDRRQVGRVLYVLRRLSIVSM